MILAYIEQTNGKLPKSALVATSAALALKAAHGYSKLVGLVAGASGAQSAATELAGYGFDEVVFVESALLEHGLALTSASLVTQAAKQLGARAVIGLSSSHCKDFFPRVAHALGAGQVSDATAFLPGGAFRRFMFAGNIVAEVEVSTETRVITARSTAFEAATKTGASAPVRGLDVTLEADPRQVFVSFETTKSERPELGDADIVVSGGRALKSAENFEKYLVPLAEVLNAAIGASRAAVDAGYAPNDLQVGQTGKVVAPKLYIAIGISGAIQHLAGMKDSKVIVAINKDGDAPIFELADYGLVGDLYQILPELTDAIRQLKN